MFISLHKMYAGFRSDGECCILAHLPDLRYFMSGVIADCYLPPTVEIIHGIVRNSTHTAFQNHIYHNGNPRYRSEGIDRYDIRFRQYTEQIASQCECRST